MRFPQRSTKRKYTVKDPQETSSPPPKLQATDEGEQPLFAGSRLSWENLNLLQEANESDVESEGLTQVPVKDPHQTSSPLAKGQATDEGETPFFTMSRIYLERPDLKIKFQDSDDSDTDTEDESDAERPIQSALSSPPATSLQSQEGEGSPPQKFTLSWLKTIWPDYDFESNEMEGENPVKVPSPLTSDSDDSLMQELLRVPAPIKLTPSPQPRISPNVSRISSPTFPEHRTFPTRSISKSTASSRSHLSTASTVVRPNRPSEGLVSSHLFSKSRTHKNQISPECLLSDSDAVTKSRKSASSMSHLSDASTVLRITTPPECTQTMSVEPINNEFKAHCEYKIYKSKTSHSMTYPVRLPEQIQTRTLRSLPSMPQSTVRTEKSQTLSVTSLSCRTSPQSADREPEVFGSSSAAPAYLSEIYDFSIDESYAERPIQSAPSSPPATSLQSQEGEESPPQKFTLSWLKTIWPDYDFESNEIEVTSLSCRTSPQSADREPEVFGSSSAAPAYLSEIYDFSIVRTHVKEPTEITPFAPPSASTPKPEEQRQEKPADFSMSWVKTVHHTDFNWDSSESEGKSNNYH